MHQQTYKRHYKILEDLKNWFYRVRRKIVKKEILDSIDSIIKSIEIIQSDLINYTNELKNLRKQEKELNNILMELNWMNSKNYLKETIRKIKTNTFM